MRAVKILALALVLTLALAGVASARVRTEARHVAGHAAAILALDQSDETPAAEPSETPETEAPETEAAEADEGTASADNHGAVVSAVAQSDEVKTWVNPAGKEITNHGKAVSAIAKSGTGKPAKAQKAGGQGKGGAQ